MYKSPRLYGKKKKKRCSGRNHRMSTFGGFQREDRVGVGPSGVNLSTNAHYLYLTLNCHLSWVSYSVFKLSSNVTWNNINGNSHNNHPSSHTQWVLRISLAVCWVLLCVSFISSSQQPNEVGLNECTHFKYKETEALQSFGIWSSSHNA